MQRNFEGNDIAGSSAVDESKEESGNTSCDISLSDSVVSKTTRQHLDYLASRSIPRDISSWVKNTTTLQQPENASDVPRFYFQVFDCDSPDELVQKISCQTKDLEKACNLLLDILLLYAKRCLSRSTSSPVRILENKEVSRGKGLKLPASAIDWLSHHFSSQPLNYHLSIDTKNRFSVLPQLKVWLAKYVTHLHVNGRDTWPPRIENGVIHTHNTDGSININSNLPTKNTTIGIDNGNIEKLPDTDILFLNHYHCMQCQPMVDFSLFPNLSVLILDGVPLEWISNLGLVKEQLIVLKVMNTCICDVNKLFAMSEKALGDESEQVSLTPQTFQLLEHITLSHAALGELSKMRGCDQFQPAMSYFPNLKSLDLSHNEINKRSTALAGLSNLMNLSTIDLSHNFVTRCERLRHFI